MVAGLSDGKNSYNIAVALRPLTLKGTWYQCMATTHLLNLVRPTPVEDTPPGQKETILELDARGAYLRSEYLNLSAYLFFNLLLKFEH